MKKILKYILIVVIIGVAIGISIGIYQFNKPHKNIAKSKADFTIPASQLYNEFSNNENAANQKYLDKIIEVSGTVAELSTNDKGEVTVILREPTEMSGVSCTIAVPDAKKVKKAEKGKQIKIKGTCTGILLDVVLVHCVIEE